jgi:hypothetical protein
MTTISPASSMIFRPSVAQSPAPTMDELVSRFVALTSANEGTLVALPK